MVDAKTVAAIAAVIVAIVSLCVNVVFALLLRRKRTPVARFDDIREALLAMLNAFESRLMDVPDSERWDHGFVRLAKIRKATGNCRLIFNAADDSIVPPEHKAAVSDLYDGVYGLYKLQDSFREFAAGREHLSDADMRKWNDIESAESDLTALQNNYRVRKTALQSFLREIS